MAIPLPVVGSAMLEPPRDGVVRGACPHDCPDTCAWEVTVENGRATRMSGDGDHPFTRGFLCAKVNRYIERTYHRDRLTTPLRRVGAKGEGRFEPVSWNVALTEIAARLRAIVDSPDGPQAILPYSYAGTMGMIQGESMDRRFFHALGASRLLRMQRLLKLRQVPQPRQRRIIRRIRRQISRRSIRGQSFIRKNHRRP